jgi:uncharacterized Zn finger protein (UPF0148 family)
MRCNKCGYDGANNVPGGTCVKCGTPLSGDVAPQVPEMNSGASDYQSRPTMIGIKPQDDVNLKATVVGGNTGQSIQLKKTVVQGAVPEIGNLKSTIIQSSGSAPNQPSPSLNVSGELVCPMCGYPIAEHYTSCPNCGADFTGADETEGIQKTETKAEETQSQEPVAPQSRNQSENGAAPVASGTIALGSMKDVEEDINIICTCEKCGEEISATYRFCPKCGEKIHQRTLQGFRHKKKKEVEETSQPTFKAMFNLTIVPEEDEDMNAEAIHYEGAEVMLNRDNTEPDNRTITSKEQAVVLFEDHKWYIENRSEYDSTMIIANRKMEIQSGDVILLGDRRFRFESEESKES